MAPWLRALARLVLALAAPEDRDEALADLEELYRRRAGGSGSGSGSRSQLVARARLHLYLLRQIFHFAPRLALERHMARRRVRPARTARVTAPRLPPHERTSAMDTALQDLRHAVRRLLHTPGFTVVVIATLAVCIGANAAISSVVREVLVEPLPMAEPERVVSVSMTALPEYPRLRVTPGNFSDLRELTDVFEALAAYSGVTTTLTQDAFEPELLRGGRVTGEYFDVLGVRPAIGRPFAGAELEQGGPSVVILGHELWVRRFGADPSIVGELVALDGSGFEVVGVMPPGLYPTSAAITGEVALGRGNQDFLVPLRYSAELYTNRRPHIVGVIGRLRREIPVERAAETVETLGARLAETDPQNAGEGLILNPLRDDIVGTARPGLLVLLATVGMVLLIAVTNIATLLLLRSESRRAELALRRALGAGTWRLLRLHLSEITLLTAAGAALGIGVAALLLGLIKQLVPVQIPRLELVGVDAEMIAFTLLASIVVAAVAGLAPAFGGDRQRDPVALRQGTTGLTSGQGRRRVQAGLVAAQVGIAVVLVVGAGLLVRTYAALTAVDMGFRTAGVWALPVTFPDGFDTAGQAFRDQLSERLAAIPGVDAVGMAADHPLQRSWQDGFGIEGVAEDDESGTGSASVRPVDEGYFRAAGIDLLAGRVFEATDDSLAAGVVVINAELARRHFGAGDALGQRIRLPTAQRFFGDAVPETWEIVGVVGNVRFLGPDAEPEPALYFPMRQFPTGGATVLVRTATAGPGVLASLREVVWEVDDTQPMRNARRLEAIAGDQVAAQRFGMLLVGAFAATGLLLSAMGIYGLVSRMVGSRAREIGVRMALGASRSNVRGEVLRDALAPTAVGAVAGLVAAFLLSRFTAGLLFGVTPLDPLSYVVAPALLLGAAALAAALPAARASRLDPATSLRD